MPERNTSHPPDPFDTCFAARRDPHGSLEARMRAVRAKAVADPQSEDTLDEWLEAQLSRWPVAPRPDSQEAVRARLQPAAAGSRLPLSLLCGNLAVGLAACLVLVLLPFEDVGDSFEGGISSGSDHPRIADEKTREAELQPDLEATRIFALAQGLEEPSRWLLTESPLTTLATALPQGESPLRL